MDLEVCWVLVEEEVEKTTRRTRSRELGEGPWSLRRERWCSEGRGSSFEHI